MSLHPRQSFRILLFDENPNDGLALRRALGALPAGYEVSQLVQAESIFSGAGAPPAPVAAVVDWSLAFADAGDLVRRIATTWPGTQVIVFCRAKREEVRVRLGRLGLAEAPLLVDDFAALVALVLRVVEVADAAVARKSGAPGRAAAWDQAPFGMARVNIREGTIVEANPLLARWLECEPAALAGASFEKLHPPEQVRRLAARFAARSPELPATSVEVSFSSGGGTRFADALVAPSDDGQEDRRTVFYVDAAERRAMERKWRRLAETIFQTGSGEAFFHTLVQGLCGVLEVDMAAVALVLPGEPARARIVAMCDRGALVAGFELAMADNPCEQVLRHRFLCVARRFSRAYPEARWLVERGTESYLGLPLADRAGRPIGILEVMHRQPLRKTRDLRAVMQVFAARGAAELERLQAEVARRRTEAGLAHTQRLARIGSWELELATGALVWSDETYRIHGLDRAGFQPTPAGALALAHPDDRSQVERAVSGALAGGGFPRFQHRIVRPDGAVRHLECEGELVTAAGQPVLLRGTMLDVTEREAREAEARQLAAIAQVAESAVLLTDRGRRVTWANEALTRLTGREGAAALGCRVEEIFPGADGADANAAAITVLWAGGARSADLPCRHPTGRVFWVNLRVQPLRPAGAGAADHVAVATDITERKLTEGARRLVTTDLGHRRGGALFAHLAGETARLLGCQVCLLARLTDPARQRARTLAWWRDGADQPEMEYALADTPCAEVVGAESVVHGAGVAARFPHDHFLRAAEVESYAGVPMFAADGAVLGHVAVLDRRPLDRPPEQVLAVLRIVAARAEVEVVREDGERMFRGLFARAPDATLLVSQRGRIVLANEAALRMFGYAAAELTGMTVEQLMPERARAGHAGQRAAFHRAAVPRPMGADRPGLQGLRKDGSVFPVDISLSPLDTPEGPGVVAAIRDMTAQRLAEAQLRQGQKLESLGRLAGGIAHDFNNILSGILGFAELMLLEISGGHPLRDHVLKIQQAGLRARALVAQILTVSRRTTPELRPVHLAAVAREVVELLHATVPDSVELRLAPPGPLPAILADASQLHQVVMNLCTNAWQALPGGRGCIHLALDPLVVDAARAATLPGLSPGPHVRLTVSDDGCGMDAATLERVFDPFFTTKMPGRGTGLGLAVVNGIVHTHGGAITVRSAPGAGTVFEVFFPAVLGEVPAAPATVPLAAAGSGQRVLLVEDDPATGPALEKALLWLGYRPTWHRDPAAALAELERDAAAFDLLLTDLTMPTMTGVLLAQHARRLRPDLPVVLTTGLESVTTHEAAKAAGVREVLLKPVPIEQLRAALRRCLG